MGKMVLVALTIGLFAATPAQGALRGHTTGTPRLGLHGAQPLLQAPTATVLSWPGDPAVCPRMCTDGTTIYVGAIPAPDPTIAAFRLEHEKGHLADRQYLTAAERALLVPLFGYPPGMPWDLGTTTHGGSPDERFADAYAACRLGLSPDGGEWVMTQSGYAPTARQHRRACIAISHAVAR